MEKYLYEAVFTPNELGGYDVAFPDFGLVTQGSDLADAAFMAQDLLTLHIASELHDGKDIAKVGSFDFSCPQDGMVMGIVVVADAGIILDDYMTIQEAADVLDVSRARIYALIDSGELFAQKMGTARMVLAKDVMERFNNPRGAGRPRKAAMV